MQYLVNVYGSNGSISYGSEVFGATYRDGLFNAIMTIKSFFDVTIDEAMDLDFEIVPKLMYPGESLRLF